MMAHDAEGRTNKLGTAAGGSPVTRPHTPAAPDTAGPGRKRNKRPVAVAVAPVGTDVSEPSRNQVIPELEIFEAGMISNVMKLAEEGVLPGPHHYNFCLGFQGALPAKPENLFFLKSLLPEGTPWGLIHEGMDCLSLAATAIGLGAAVVRVGFEDGVALESGKIAITNTELVERLVSLVKVMGCRAATTQEARILFGVAK